MDATTLKILIRTSPETGVMPEENEEKNITEDIESDEASSEEEAEGPGPDEKYCRNCGEIIDEEAEICPECGVRVKDSSGNNVNINMENNQVQSHGNSGPMVSNKSKILAGILGMLLGGLGLHKFYLGQAGRGVLFLLFFWTGIPAIVGFIQGLSYLFMSEQRFAQKFG